MDYKKIMETDLLLDKIIIKKQYLILKEYCGFFLYILWNTTYILYSFCKRNPPVYIDILTDI